MDVGRNRHVMFFGEKEKKKEIGECLLVENKKSMFTPKKMT